MKVVLDDGRTIVLGETEATPTISIVDYSRRVTDDFGVTTVVERGFARRMAVRLVVPFGQADALQRTLADLRATPAQWVADDRFEWLNFRGFYKDFEIDLSVPPVSYCTLTVEGLAETEPVADAGGDPAPGGDASTLQLLQPVEIQGAGLVASSVAENDYPEWSASTTYALGARVIKAATHRIYESAAAGNTGNDPVGVSGKWIDVGPTKRWAMFDQALGSVTSAAGSISVTLAAGDLNAVALLDVKGGAVRVQTAGYDRTMAPNAAGTVTFLDLPTTANQVTVTVTGNGQVEIGTLLIGTLLGLGSTIEAPKAGITDYSRKEADEFGEVQVVERAWAKRMSVQAMLRADALDVVASRIAGVRATPALWIGKEGMETLTAYGFFKEFSIEVGATVSKLTLSVEGMSTAGKVEPLGSLVNWDDIADPNGAKPQDNATVGAPVGTPVAGVPAEQVVGKIEDAETALAAAQVNISQIQTDAAATRAALEGEIGELGQQAEQTILDVQANAAALAAQASTLAAHDSAIGQNQQALQSQAGTLAAQAATLLAHGADIGQAQADIVAAGGRMTTVEQTLGQQGATISSVSQTVDNAVGRLSSVETTLSAQGATVSLHASAISTAQQDIAGLRIDVASNGAAISQTASTVSGLGVSVANLAQTVTAGGGNLLDNTDFASSETLPWLAESWQIPAANFTAGLNAAGDAWHPIGINALSMRQFGPASDPSGYVRWRQTVQVQPGKWYEGSVWFAAHRAQVVLILAFYDRAGAYLSEASVAGVHESGGTDLALFRRIHAKAQAPSSARSAILYLSKLNTSPGYDDSYAWFLQPQVAETLEDTVGPVPFAPGRNKAVADIHGSAISTAQGALATLENTVSTQGATVSGLSSAMTSAQGSLAQLASDVSANGASISSLQSAVTGIDGQMASTVTSLSAEPNAINRNGRFADWPQSAPMPNKWVTWAGSSYRAAGLSSQWAVEMDCLEGFQSGIMSRSIDDASLGTIVPGSWLVLEADVEFLAGSGAGSGLLLQFTGAQGEFRGEVSIPLVLPALGRRYKFEKIVQAPDYAGAPVALNGHIYAMGSWTGFGELVYKRLRWHRASVRYATPDEIELNRPLGLKAQVTQTATALSSVEGTLAQLGNTVSAQGASVSQLSSAMATAQGDIGTLSQTVSAHGASISTLDQSVSTLGQNASNLAKRTSIIEATAIGDNGMLLNGNFETDLTGWDIFNISWVPGDYGIGGLAHAPDNLRGEVTYSSYLPVYPETRSYKLSLRFASRGYGLIHYAGLRCFGADKTHIGNVYMPGVAGQQQTYDWHLREQVFSGVQDYGPAPIFVVGTKFPVGCRFVQPLFYGNYNATPGYADLDYIRFVDASDFVANDARITQTALALSTATTDLASLSQTVSAQGVSVSQLSQAMVTAQAQLGTLESTVATQGVSVSQLSSAMSTAQADIGTLKTQVTAGGGNLLENTEFSGDFTPWYLDYHNIPASDLWFGLNPAGSPYTVPGADALGVRQIGSVGSEGLSYARWGHNKVPVEGGKWYEASCWMASHRANTIIVVVWTNEAGEYLGEINTGAFMHQGGGTSLGAFYRAVCKGQAPLAATRALFILQKYGTLPGYDDSYAWFIRPQLRETTQDAVSPLPYSPGSMRAVVNQQFSAVSTLQSTSASMATTLSAHDASIAQNATAISSAAGRVATLESTVGTQGVSVSQLSQAMATAQGDIATLSQTVSAQGVTVSQHSQAISAVQGDVTTLFGRYAVGVDAGGRWTGLEVYGTPTGGGIDLHADYLRISRPGGGARTEYSGGVWRVYAGSVMSAWGAGFGSSSQFVRWFGPAVATLAECTEGNAISYERLDGNAYFGGALSTGQFRNSITGSLTSDPADTDLGPFGTNGNFKTVNVSGFFRQVQGGFSSGPTRNGGAATPSFRLTLFRSRDGVNWTQLQQQTFNGTYEITPAEPGTPGSYAVDASGAFTYVDQGAGGTQPVYYRARIDQRAMPTFGGSSTQQIQLTQRATIVSTEG
ncbi:hypothetical protein [Novosphingobium sp. HII-3]|uniref:hypothetical protein n=1 Tax=Novosphingobium sp. HII-3 TaxID=2075565 RepID=UPI000CDA1299|nr:hypothetical protein [Novosphingobium sp. HII-3]